MLSSGLVRQRSSCEDTSLTTLDHIYLLKLLLIKIFVHVFFQPHAANRFAHSKRHVYGCYTYVPINSQNCQTTHYIIVRDTISVILLTHFLLTFVILIPSWCRCDLTCYLSLSDPGHWHYSQCKEHRAKRSLCKWLDATDELKFKSSVETWKYPRIPV